ncbi:MAG: alpha/beta fold hydrolase [Candidatus Hodarchaeales archaeon]|jgi:pimeloyl-ACP methyl ester carboxylesterase
MNKQKGDLPEYHPFKSHEAKKTFLKYYDEKAKIWPIASENEYVETSFGQTFVRISGPKNSQPLVLIPGDSVTSLTSLPMSVIEELSKRYRIYALDQIYDIGRSIYTRPIKKPEDYVQWLEEMFTELGLKNINLMGYSYGGWQASLYALTHPERLNKLILLAPAATVLPARYQVIIRAILYYFIPTKRMIKNYIYWQFPDSIKKSEATKEIIDDIITETILAKKSFKYGKFVNPTVLSDKDWQNLKVPTLFLTGENEFIYPATKAIKKLNTIAPKIKTEITSNAGHDLAIVKPEWVSKEVMEFLKDKRNNNI